MKNTYFTRNLLILIFAIYSFLELQSQQLCNGSLGDNIFIDGDFGMGQSPTIGIDPMIAPGYKYSTSVPRDGEYSITKNTANLAGLYGSWLKVKDNSGTPDGYYMVVNASFTPGVFFEKTIDGLCGNTTYEFSADVINLIILNPNPPHSDPNVNFLLDDVVKYGTGNIPKTEKWITYGFTFTTSPGQTSIKLTLRNNAPGGIGNDLGLDNIKFRPCGPASFVGLSTDKTQFLCVDGRPFALRAKVSNNLKNQYLWQLSEDNKIWKDLSKGSLDSIVHKTFVPGQYYYRYYSAGDSISLENSKCRVLSDVVHIEVLPEIFIKYDTLCFGNLYKFGNKNLTSSGYYVETFLSSKNCDSTVQLYLTVLPDPNILVNTTIAHPSCYGYEDGRLVVQSIQGGTPPYAITYDGKKQQMTISNLDAEVKNLYVKDNYGCVDSFRYELIDPEKFKLEQLPDTNIVFGDAIDLSLTANNPIATAKWSPSNLFSCNDCVNTIGTINSSRTITANAISDVGCIDSISFEVKVDRDQTFFISNVMKLNAGTNGSLILQSYKAAVKEVERFVIYDRYGNIVSQSTKIPFHSQQIVLWDGKFNSSKIKEGVFTYLVELKLIDDSIIKRYGDLTVLH